MPELTRQTVAYDADPIVVKVGTRVLTLPDGRLDESRIASLSDQLCQIGAGKKRQVVLVSSGAVGAGIGRLGLSKRPTDLAGLQAAAAVGQSHVIEAYNQAFAKYETHVAQVLLTADDLNDRRRYLNVRNTIHALFEYGAMPIVNENDTVRTEELSRNVGDNDRLAAMVANLIDASLLVILSDVEGLYDGDPSDPLSKIIPVIDDINNKTLDLVCPMKQGEGPVLSRGGMASKLESAQVVTRAGGSVIIAGGKVPNVLVDLMEGKRIGTLLLGEGGILNARKRWIGWAALPQGKLVLDAGAVKAVESNGSSLLSVGIASVVGRFDKGDIIALCDVNGIEIARGLTNYSSQDLAKIIGLSTEEAANVLGRSAYSVAIHRNDLALTRSVHEDGSLHEKDRVKGDG